MNDIHTGTVRWFSYSKGCGFIIPDDGTPDVFAHFSAFGDSSIGSLHANDRVRYDLNHGPLGAVAGHILLLSMLLDTCQ